MFERNLIKFCSVTARALIDQFTLTGCIPSYGPLKFEAFLSPKCLAIYHQVFFTFTTIKKCKEYVYVIITSSSNNNFELTRFAFDVR